MKKLDYRASVPVFDTAIFAHVHFFS